MVRQFGYVMRPRAITPCMIVLARVARATHADTIMWGKWTGIDDKEGGKTMDGEGKGMDMTESE